MDSIVRVVSGLLGGTTDGGLSVWMLLCLLGVAALVLARGQGRRRR